MVLHEQKEFSYATVLDLKIGYYTIRLNQDASKICTIILSWGQYIPQELTMETAGSPDIFHANCWS
jgi:hypothetical protein